MSEAGRMAVMADGDALSDRLRYGIEGWATKMHLISLHVAALEAVGLDPSRAYSGWRRK